MTSAQLIDGRSISNQILLELEKKIRNTQKKPCLATVLVGNDPASEVYVASKIKKAKQVGICSVHHQLSKETSESKLLGLIHELNQDQSIHGLLVQLPLPEQIDEQKIIQSINPLKDIDGFHPENIGLLAMGAPRFVPCTPKGCMRLLQKYAIDLAGKHAVILGRSHIVGKPLALLLMNSKATVTICHKDTVDLKTYTRQADILFSATGCHHLIDSNFIKEGAVLIDIGITRLESGRIEGDVNFEDIKNKASSVTPVPGGVGPMTIAMLLENTYEASLI